MVAAGADTDVSTSATDQQALWPFLSAKERPRETTQRSRRRRLLLLLLQPASDLTSVWRPALLLSDTFGVLLLLSKGV